MKKNINLRVYNNYSQFLYIPTKIENIIIRHFKPWSSNKNFVFVSKKSWLRLLTLSCNVTRLKIWNSIPRNSRIRLGSRMHRNQINPTSRRGQQTQPLATVFACHFYTSFLNISSIIFNFLLNVIWSDWNWNCLHDLCVKMFSG